MKPSKYKREWHARTRECVRLEIARLRVDARDGIRKLRGPSCGERKRCRRLYCPFVHESRYVSRDWRTIAKAWRYRVGEDHANV